MIPNEELHDLIQSLKSENFHLKNQLNNKNRHIKNLKRSIKKYKESLKLEKTKKPKFKNGKRGTMKNGG